MRICWKKCLSMTLPRESGSLAMALFCLFIYFSILWNIGLNRDKNLVGIHKSLRGGLVCDKFKCLSLGIFVLMSAAICFIFCSQQLTPSPVIFASCFVFVRSSVQKFISVGYSFCTFVFLYTSYNFISIKREHFPYLQSLEVKLHEFFFAVLTCIMG